MDRIGAILSDGPGGPVQYTDARPLDHLLGVDCSRDFGESRLTFSTSFPVAPNTGEAAGYRSSTMARNRFNDNVFVMLCTLHLRIPAYMVDLMIITALA